MGIDSFFTLEGEAIYPFIKCFIEDVLDETGILFAHTVFWCV